MKLAVILSALLLAACSTNKTVGVAKPTITTDPANYLEAFPLDTFSKEQIITTLGVPDKAITLEDQELLSYELESVHGESEYVYVVEDNRVVDVIYNDDSVFNGSRASVLQFD